MPTHTPMTTAESWPAPGATLAARYRVESVIGRGGSSIIYRAIETGLDREVALKVLDPTGGGDADALQKRFYREARLMARLRSPATVTMFDYGRTADGLLFLVFEFVDGLTLEEVLERSGPLDTGRVRGILVQVLESLREAHQLGFLHRDIKPNNVMLYERVGERDNVKVLDFGIAKAVTAGDEGLEELTHAGTVVGTPRYLAPERIRGEQASPASDLFSLGLVAYEMLVGRSPFAHVQGLEIARKLTSERIKLPSGTRVDATLRDTIDGMLAPDPTERFQSVDDVLRSLGVEVTAPTRAANVDDNLVAFPLDFDPMGGTPVDELTGTTTLTGLTLETSSELPRATHPREPESHSEEPSPSSRKQTSWTIWIVFATLGLMVVAAVIWMTSDDPRPVRPADPVVQPTADDRAEVESTDAAAATRTASTDVHRAARFGRLAAELEARESEPTDADEEERSPPRRPVQRVRPTKAPVETETESEAEAETEVEIQAIDEIQK